MRAGRGRAAVEAQRMRRIVDGVVALTARRGVTVPFTVCRACGMREDRWHADDCPQFGAAEAAVVEAAEVYCSPVPIEPPAPPAPIPAPTIEGEKLKPAAVARPRPVKIDPATIPSAMEQRAAGWGQ